MCQVCNTWEAAQREVDAVKRTRTLGKPGGDRSMCLGEHVYCMGMRRVTDECCHGNEDSVGA